MTNDKMPLVCNELEQLQNSSAETESLEQLLVRHGEMTPFGSVVNISAAVSTFTSSMPHMASVFVRIDILFCYLIVPVLLILSRAVTIV